MSPDHDPSQADDDNEDIDQVMREAEEAVSVVRGGGSGPAAAAAEAEDDASIEARLAEAVAESAAHKDKWLRSVADLENYKKRVKRDIDDAVHRAVQGLLGDFLSVGDNLQRALSVVPEDPDEKLAPLTKGLEMVRQEFFSALAKHNIRPIESIGKSFDPNLHDALQQMDSPDYAPGVVMMEYEKGYRRGEKLLRPARVIVAGPGSTGEPPEDAQDAQDAQDSGEGN